MPPTFRYLEDIALADCAFEAIGNSPAELFDTAAQALIETMCNPTTVGRSWTKSITSQDPDLATLLFDWLNEIVYVKDAESVLFSSTSTQVTKDLKTGEWHLRGTIVGESIDPSKHELHSDVKAVTKHLYEVKQAGNQWIARVVLDL